MEFVFELKFSILSASPLNDRSECDKFSACYITSISKYIRYCIVLILNLHKTINSVPKQNRMKNFHDWKYLKFSFLSYRHSIIKR